MCIRDRNGKERVYDHHKKGGSSEELPPPVKPVSYTHLDVYKRQGLLCSAGSACHTLQPMPSHVLTAMGLSDAAVRSSLRFSLSFRTTQEEVEQAAALVGSAVRKVRGVQSSRTGLDILDNRFFFSQRKSQ